MKNQTGIWIDFNQANIIHLNQNKVEKKTIQSNISHAKPKGGSRSKVAYGPMDKISESKYLQKHKQQENKFYTEVYNEIKDCQELLIFGPAEAKEHFAKMLKEKNGFTANISGIKTMDSITENQKVAYVKEFFHQSPQRKHQ